MYGQIFADLPIHGGHNYTTGGTVGTEKDKRVQAEVPSARKILLLLK